MNKIRLFWFSEILLMKKNKENYGDLLGKYIVEKISKRKVTFVNPRHFNIKDYFVPKYYTIGSILANVRGNSIVWGSGIIQRDAVVQKAKYLAVRGPRTRERLLELGFECPAVYGDPALLLPRFYINVLPKKYKLGIIPHYVDYKQMHELYKDGDVKVIDLMTNDIEDVTKQILECEKILSTSLHGVIVPHAYNIPALWVKISDKVFGDDIKYQDYFESVDIPCYKIEFSKDKLPLEDLNSLFERYPVLPDRQKIEIVSKKLMEVCPF